MMMFRVFAFLASLVLVVLVLLHWFSVDDQQQVATELQPSADPRVAGQSVSAFDAPVPAPDRVQNPVADSSVRAVDLVKPAQPQPLWGKDDVIDEGNNYQSAWVDAASVIAVVNLPDNLVSRFAVGSRFVLPVGEQPSYLIEEKKDSGKGSVSWLAVNTQAGAQGSRYGVISEGGDLLLMTLYTDKGVYYVHSDDRSTAEVSFVDYATLKRLKAAHKQGT